MKNSCSYNLKNKVVFIISTLRYVWPKSTFLHGVKLGPERSEEPIHAVQSAP